MNAQQQFPTSATQGVAEVIAKTFGNIDSFSELSEHILTMNVEFTNSDYYEMLSVSQKTNCAYLMMQMVQLFNKLDKIAPELVQTSNDKPCAA